MPCRSDDYCESDEEISKLNKKISQLEDMLCSVCTVLDSVNVQVPPTAIVWWENHKQMDAMRKKWEEERKIRELKVKELRNSALEKLTKDERDVLGLR